MLDALLLFAVGIASAGAGLAVELATRARARRGARDAAILLAAGRR